METFGVRKRINFQRFLPTVTVQADDFEQALQIGLVQLRKEFPFAEYRDVELVELPFWMGESSAASYCRLFDLEATP